MARLGFLIKIHSEGVMGNHSPTDESRWIFKTNGPDFRFSEYWFAPKDERESFSFKRREKGG